MTITDYSVTPVHKGGTAAAMAAANPVLEAREIGVETDTGRAKVGDGATAYNDLPYIGPVPGAWTPVATLPTGWTNVADDIGDPEIPTLATRDQPTTESVEICGHLTISPADIVTGLDIGRLTVAGVIPLDQRPATLVRDVPAHFAVLPDFEDPESLVTFPAVAFITPTGDLAFEIGGRPDSMPADLQASIFAAFGTAVAAAADLADVQAAIADLVADLATPPTFVTLFDAGGLWENATPMSGGIVVLVVNGSYSLS